MALEEDDVRRTAGIPAAEEVIGSDLGEVRREVRSTAPANPQEGAPRRRQHGARQQRPLEEYFLSLPSLAIARCPFCQTVGYKRIDSESLDGPWWRSYAYDEPPEACSHFVTYFGSLPVERLDPSLIAADTTDTVRIGSDAPYVVPRLLECDSVCPVLSQVPLFDPPVPATLVTYYSEPPLDAVEWVRDWTSYPA